MYLPPGADSEKAGRTRREGKAEEWGIPQEPQATEIRWVGEGVRRGWDRERQKQQRETRRVGGREGERGKKTSYIHMRIGQALSLPEWLSPHQGSHEHLCQCLAPAHLPGHALGQEGPPVPCVSPGGHPHKVEDKNPSPWPKLGMGTHVNSSTNWLCDLRTFCPLWDQVWQTHLGPHLLLQGDLLLCSLWCQN